MQGMKKGKSRGKQDKEGMKEQREKRKKPQHVTVTGQNFVFNDHERS